MDTPEKRDDKAPDTRTKEQAREDSIREIDEYVRSKQEKSHEDIDEATARIDRESTPEK
jgi:hypothetical protein